MQITGRHYATGEWLTVTCDPNHGTIDRVESAELNESQLWLCPGFVDLQINGYHGREFTDPNLTVDQVGQIGRAVFADGVTRYLPTVVTQSAEVIGHALATIAAAMESDPVVKSQAVGIHLEGPYISSVPGPKGAHPEAHCRAPDWDEFCRFQDLAQGHIRLLTLAPELDGAIEFIRKAAGSGVLVALGHTNANSDQITAAADAGARMSTHLGNAAHGQIQRHPNYIWDQLAEDRLSASLIADGHHLPNSVLKCMLRAKGVQRCVLVSDITGMGGMPPGHYPDGCLGAVEILADGRLVIAGQRQLLAGAALPITVGVGKVVEAAGLSLRDAIDMASVQPARLLGLPAGSLETGSAADLLACSWDGTPYALKLRSNREWASFRQHDGHNGPPRGPIAAERVTAGRTGAEPATD